MVYREWERVDFIVSIEKDEIMISSGLVKPY